MKNIDKIKEMNSDEMVKLLNGNKCNICTYNNTNCLKEFCKKGIKSWLEQEAELTIEDIHREFEEFCGQNSCRGCKYPDDATCYYGYILEHFNIIDGKITRR